MYIGLGSNIAPENNLRAAAAMLQQTFPTIRFSSVYRSAAQLMTNQADFLNAAAVFTTTLSPKEVSAELQTIEKKLKKNPPKRFGPRTIDLDILLFGQKISDHDNLTIPHPRLHERRFVLQPLIDLGAGNLLHPSLSRTLSEYLSETKDQHCEKTDMTL